jgi:hypothetical protein
MTEVNLILHPNAVIKVSGRLNVPNPPAKAMCRSDQFEWKWEESFAEVTSKVLLPIPAVARKPSP